MKRPIRSLCFLAGLALIIAGAPSFAWAGGDALGGPDEHGPDEGPAYWGFVKDARGAPVRDAKVTASYKSSVTLVTRTNATGAYKVRGFRNDISPDDVVISCSKEGYKQVRLFRRPPAMGKPVKSVKSVETECRLQLQ